MPRLQVSVRFAFLRAWRDDARSAWRALMRAKGFTAIAVLTCGLGVTVNLVVFSVVNRLLFLPLPYGHADRLVQIHQAFARLPDGGVSPLVLPEEISRTLQREAASLRGVAWEAGLNELVRPAPGETPLVLATVTANLLDVLQAAPVLGRPFAVTDAVTEEHSVLLTHAAWASRFGKDEHVLSAVWMAGSRRYRVVGVLPGDFLLPSSRFRERLDGIVMAADEPDRAWRRGSVAPVARLRPGVTVEAAEREIDALLRNRDWRNSALRRMAAAGSLHVFVEPLRSGLTLMVGPYLWVLTRAVWVLLAAAAVNLSMLLVIRGRAREIDAAVRLALGAPGGRLARVALLEAGTLVALGVLAAVLLCVWGQAWITTVVPPDLRGVAVEIWDRRVLAIAVAATAAMALAASVAPGRVLMRRDLIDVLRGDSRTARRRSAGAGGGGVALQAAVGTLLVVGAVITVPPLVRFLVRPPGFNVADLYVLSVGHDWSTSLASSPKRQRERIRTVVEVVSSAPHVKGVSVARPPPFVESRESEFWRAQGVVGGEWAIWTDLFRVLNTPVKVGRDFTDSDLRDSATSVILNETGARILWPEVPPSAILGRPVEVAGRTREVVGVVDDIRPHPGVAALPALFVPMVGGAGEQAQSTLLAIVRMEPGAVPDLSLLGARLDERFPPNRVAAAAVAAELAPFVDRPRFLAIVFGWLAAVAVLFAVVGTYAVSRLETSRRVHDLAVHLALGASAMRLYRLALGRTMGATAVGIVAGLGCARAAMAAAPYVLEQTTAASPAPYGLAALVMVAASLLAVWPQARRIVRMTPAGADRFGASRLA